MDAMRRYELARDDLAKRLSRIAEDVDESLQASINDAAARLSRGNFVLAIVGEFSTGKSFLLNALLGRVRYEDTPAGKRITGLLATDINPSTATITELEYGKEERATALYENGRRERIPMDRLSRFIAVGGLEPGKLHDATRDQSDAPSRVIVALGSPFLARGFTVADTPGLASINPAHRRATLQFLPKADAVLYLIDTQQPFSEGDAAFLEIIRSQLDTIFIVQTKIDLWQSRQSDGRPQWEHARERIAQLASVHAPATQVFAISARDYAQGKLDNNADLIEASQFAAFERALDDSLIATTGRSRLRRAQRQADAAIEATLRSIQRDQQMLAASAGELKALESHAQPRVNAMTQALASERESLREQSELRGAYLTAQADELFTELQDELVQAFDTADIARLRDRARLHILIDRLFGSAIGEFAARIAAREIEALASSQKRASTEAPLVFSAADAAASAFGGEPGTGPWAGSLQDALTNAIVLEAIGGPAITLVHEISSRFAAAQPGAYMKRELTADLRAHIFPLLRKELSEFVGQIASRFAAIADALCTAMSEAASAFANEELGSIERAREAIAQNAVAQMQHENEARKERLMHQHAAISEILERFMADAPVERAQLRAPIVERAKTVSFDQEAYGKGLRPQRFRIAVLGALRRGKSSLINAIAGTRVLADEVPGVLAFPVHVRYGPTERAYALNEQSEWIEVEIESALEEATRNPVLIETPWSLPKELVLVHVPAFDGGAPHVEELALVAASKASEVICLFSRQLSDRELDIFERVSSAGKPLLFVHTIADNETPAERRQVVELAKTYLEERKIPARRIFTISTLEYAQAKRDGRAPAGWNELDALVSTIAADAEMHMARLERLRRISEPPAESSEQPAIPTAAARGGLGAALRRLLGARD